MLSSKINKPNPPPPSKPGINASSSTKSSAASPCWAKSIPFPCLIIFQLVLIFILFGKTVKALFRLKLSKMFWKSLRSATWCRLYVIPWKKTTNQKLMTSTFTPTTPSTTKLNGFKLWKLKVISKLYKKFSFCPLPSSQLPLNLGYIPTRSISKVLNC